MGFGRKRSQDETVSKFSTQFAGRHELIEDYKRNFALPHNDNEVRPIVAVSGVGGVGKSFLVNQLMQLDSTNTVYSKVGAIDDIGDDIIGLLNALCRNARVAGKAADFYQTNRLMARHHELVMDITRGVPDIPKAVSDILFGGLKLTVGTFAGPRVAGIIDHLVPRESATQFLDVGLDKLVRALKDKEVQTLLKEPRTVLTRAFVEDINQLAAARYKVVLVFDDYDAIGSRVNAWLLKDLLGRFRDDIDVDLRLLIAGRKPLADTDDQWHDDWMSEGLVWEAELKPFTDDEIKEYLRLNTSIFDDSVVKKVALLTHRLPLWVDMWARSGQTPDSYEANLDLATVAERILRWLPSERERGWMELAACCRWFDEDVLMSVLGRDAAREACDWLLSERSLVRGFSGKWALHDAIKEVLEEYIKRRSELVWLDWHNKLGDYFEALKDTLGSEEQHLPALMGKSDWQRALLSWLFHRVQSSGKSPSTMSQYVGVALEALEYNHTLLDEIASLADCF